MAGVTVIVPAAVVAGLTTSGASAGNSSSMLAMAGAKTAPAHPDAGIPLMDAARREVARLEVRRARAERAAERAAARRAAERRAAKRAAEHRAQQAAAAAATPAPSPNPQNSGGSAPQPSGNPQQVAAAMLGSYGWSSSQFGCLVSLWNVESGWNVHASNPSSGAYGIPQALYGSPCGAWAHSRAAGWYKPPVPVLAADQSGRFQPEGPAGPPRGAIGT